MKCFYCNKEFEIIKRQGGQNRQVCYDCLPDNLNKTERTKAKRNLIIQKANNMKLEWGCTICGYNKCPTALEWHHDNDDKSFNPSDKIKDGTVTAFDEYLKEVEKCILLCANCHREKHYINGELKTSYS